MNEPVLRKEHLLHIVKIEFMCMGCGEKISRKGGFYVSNFDMEETDSFAKRNPDVVCPKPYLCTYCNSPACNGGC